MSTSLIDDHSKNAVVTMGDRGRVVIPQAMREAADLKAGDRLIVSRGEYGITLMTRDEAEAKMWANLVHPEVSLVDELIADRRAEALKDMED